MPKLKRDNVVGYPSDVDHLKAGEVVRVIVASKRGDKTSDPKASAKKEPPKDKKM